MMAINFSGYAFRKINKENYDLWGTIAEQKLDNPVEPTSVIKFSRCKNFHKCNKISHKCDNSHKRCKISHKRNKKISHKCNT